MTILVAYVPRPEGQAALDKGIELAKHFGATDSHRYINGVLNQLARQMRATEVSMDFPADTGRDPKAD